MNEYVEISSAIVNTLAILGSLISVKVFIKWLEPKLKTKTEINKLIIERGCKECPKNEYIDYFNGGFCQWQNPARFGRSDLKECKCFVEKGASNEK